MYRYKWVSWPFDFIDNWVTVPGIFCFSDVRLGPQSPLIHSKKCFRYTIRV